jgi:hypothetical protein
VPHLRQLGAAFSPQSVGFIPRRLYVTLLVGEVAQEPSFRRVSVGFPLIIIIRPLLHTFHRPLILAIPGSACLTLGFISDPALDWDLFVL